MVLLATNWLSVVDIFASQLALVRKGLFFAASHSEFMARKERLMNY